MKELKILTVVNTVTDTQKLTNLIDGREGVQVTVETEIEKAVDIMHLSRYDLLVLDKSLVESDFKKLDRLGQLLHPEAVSLHLNFDDEEFIRFKINALMRQWAEAQSERAINFFDGMSALQ